MSIDHNHEIVIIGGGPAGSAAAVYLAQNNFDVCLVEKKLFPRETLCGEFLSREVACQLTEMNLFEEFLSLNPNPISSFRMIDDSAKEIFAKLNFTGYGLKRSTFDNFLLKAACKKGIEILQPAEVIKIEKENTSFSLWVKLNSGDIINLKSKKIIAAYGKQNILDKQLNRKFAGVKSKINGVKFHIDSERIKNFNGSEIRIYISDGIYCGLNKVNDNQITLCFLEDRNKLNGSSIQNLKGLFSSNRKFSVLIPSDLLDEIKMHPVYGSGNIFFGKRELVQKGIFMIGDAAGVIAPLAGDGIGMAFESAKLISNLLDDLKQGKINRVSLDEKYKICWKKIFGNRLRTAAAIQKVLLNKNLRRPILNIAKLFPQILPQIIKVTRG